MAKTKDLKRKLKAADRRRRGRVNAVNKQSEPTAAPTDTPAVKFDVIDAITTVILDHAENSKAKTFDAAVVAALRGCLICKEPSGDDSKLLWQSISKIANHPDVTANGFRKGITELLSLHKTNQRLDDPGSFVDYLQFMAN